MWTIREFISILCEEVFLVKGYIGTASLPEALHKGVNELCTTNFYTLNLISYRSTLHSRESSMWIL